MSFNLTSQNPKLVDVVGSFAAIAVGLVAMASGTATVTVPDLREIQGVVGTVQGATGVGETVICTATSGNTFTIETISEAGAKTGTSVVMWFAWGKARL